ISKDTSFCYIGSTNLTVAKREYNRVAELKQLKQLKLPKTEIAIRYWHDKQNSELFSTLLLSKHTEYIDAWAEEHSLIQRWQPKLNYPFVTKELVKKAHGLVPARQQPHLQKPPDTLAKQLFKKIRRRLQGQKRRLVNALPKQAQFWKILYAISSDTKQEYNASRELRIGKHDNETVTLLYRLANHMEHPGALRHEPDSAEYSIFATLPHKVDIGNPSRASVKNFYANIPALNNIKVSRILARPSTTSELATPSFHPNGDYMIKFLINFDGGLNIIYFPTTIASSKTSKPSLRLIKHLLSALPDNYIIHNEDHANAHLMIYCPNVYNQAAVNTWMDEKTFLLLDKSPQAIKEDMERQTPPAVRKHYKKLLDYNKPIPYGYIMMKRKKQWNKGRTIIAYSNTCVGRFMSYFVPTKNNPIESLYFSTTYVDNRAIIVDKDVLHNNPHIWQLASLHFYKKPVQLEDENCDDFLGFRINENNRLPSELLRASALTRRGAPAMVFSVGAYYHAGSVGIRSNTRKYPCVSALPAYMIRACTHSNFSAVSLLHNVNMATHVDRYNQPGSTNVLVRSLNAQLKPVERSQHPCSIPAWTYTDGWSSELPVADDLTNDEYNHSIRVKSMALADAHSLACDMHIQRIVNETPEIIAYTILEVTFDLRALVHLAQTNKATWIRCSQILRATSTECKIQTNAPWHKRAGRAVDAQATETPIDIKMCLFNKRMHTWYHHELSYQQYMDLQVRELLPAP
ncbi:unnamed protein product, partial [Symbiodinium sp. KB8]